MMRCPDCSTRHNGSHVCLMDGVETRESTLGKRVKRIGERPKIEAETMSPDLSLDDILRLAQEQQAEMSMTEEAIPEGGPRSILNDPPKIGPYDHTEPPRVKHIGMLPEQIREALYAEGGLVPPQIDGSDQVAGKEFPDETILQALRRLKVRYTIETHSDTGRKWVKFPLDQLVKQQGNQRVGDYRPKKDV